VRFRQGTYELSLFLEKKKANTFSGILGLRPDEATGKMNITGDAEIKLLNALNSGEELYMNWRKLQPQTQDILLRTSLPFLFGTPVGADAELKIYKRDSTFSQVKSRLGATLRLGGNNKLKLFAEKNTVSQLSQVAIATSLANVNTNFYGLALQWEKLDYRNNPRKGMTLQCEAATGTRQVRGTNLDTDAAPVDVQDKNVNRAEVMAEFYLPTWKAQCLRMASQAATIAAPQLFDNEAYRIGGLRTLRGVNEESLYATSWTVATLEYRFLLSENSALYAFADKAWYEKRTINQYIADSPFSFGAGINFETGAGIFAFNYALGSQFSQPILFRNAKLSFGFKSVF
ncbi:MAG: hypothetical protein ACKVOR_02645, partial [Flavobacteriales bacterium]